jgi:hypothetical protein
MMLLEGSIHTYRICSVESPDSVVHRSMEVTNLKYVRQKEYGEFLIDWLRRLFASTEA